MAKEMSRPEVALPAQLGKEAAAELELQQEAIILQKYGGMKPKNYLLQQHKKTSRKCFDSADWALAKEGKSCDDPQEKPIETLPIKMQPTTPVLPRRHSNLGDC